MTRPVIGTELGPEFDLTGAIQAGRIRLKLGPGLAIQPDGTIVATAVAYEYRSIWAEEAGGLATSNDQWSFGNGATGDIGIPLGDGWEVIEMSAHADGGSVNSAYTVAAMDFRVASAPAEICRITVNSETDGENRNNSFRVEDFRGSPAPVPDGGALFGFRTINETGVVSDARVCCLLRRLASG